MIMPYFRESLLVPFYTSLNADISGTGKDIKKRSMISFQFFPYFHIKKVKIFISYPLRHLFEHLLRFSMRRKTEKKKREEQAQSGVNQYYGIEAVLAVGVIDGLGYYIYWTKKGDLQGPASGEVKDVSIPRNNTPSPQTNKFEIDQFIQGLIKWTRRV